jgi:hypothetical protein
MSLAGYRSGDTCHGFESHINQMLKRPVEFLARSKIQRCRAGGEGRESQREVEVSGGHRRVRSQPEFYRVGEKWGRSQQPPACSSLLSLLRSCPSVLCEHSLINLQAVAASSAIRRQLTNYGTSAALSPAMSVAGRQADFPRHAAAASAVLPAREMHSPEIF